MDEIKGGRRITSLNGDFPVVQHIRVKLCRPLQSHVPKDRDDTAISYPLTCVLDGFPMARGEHDDVTATTLRQVMDKAGDVCALRSRADRVDAEALRER